MSSTWMRFAMHGARVRVMVLGAALIPLGAACGSQAGVLTIEWVEDTDSFVRLFTPGAVDANGVHRGAVGAFWPTTFFITALDGGDPEFGDVLRFDILSTVHAIPPHGEPPGAPYVPLPPPNHVFIAGTFNPGFHTLLFDPVALPHEAHVDLYAGELSFTVAGTSALAGFTSYSVLLTGVHTVPAPSAMAVLCLGLFISRRRRRAA